MTLHLVTGGTGFLGRHLVGRLLQQGKNVRVLARASSDVSGLESAEIVRGDITSRDDLATALEGVSRVFHVAGEVADGKSAEHYDKVNHKAVVALAELSAERGVERLIHTSHYYALGRSGEPRSAPDFVNNEFWTHDPGDMHDANEESQCDAENAINQRVSLSEQVLALIPTMMYGAEARPISGRADLSPGNRIVAMLAAQAAGDYPGIPGDGRQWCNLVHVEDVAAAHIVAMDADDPRDAAEVWPPSAWANWHYICGGENVRLGELFERFGRLAGVSQPASVKLKTGLLGRLFGGSEPVGRSKERFAIDSHSWAFDSGVAETDWGYTHRSLDEGLEQTVAWMRSAGLLAT
ncbi:MAG: nucleoside-diphosphate-sugar epimerase [Pseudohongiellaceae bacterium]|jgi:nucleoside-diphosphate-sugar epimerase